MSTKAAGKTISAFHVHGVNCLKTYEPGPDALAGESFGPFEHIDGADYRFAAGPYVVAVGLQRTGRVAYRDAAVPWRPGAPSMPTAQVIFDDGSGLEFTEPGRTKRVTFGISDPAG